MKYAQSRGPDEDQTRLLPSSSSNKYDLDHLSVSFLHRQVINVGWLRMVEN